MNKQRRPIMIGLDIGTSHVIAIAAILNEKGKLEILGYGRSESFGIENGVVLNIDQCMHSIENAIENCKAGNAELDIKDIYLCIGDNHIKAIHTRGERLRKNAETEISAMEIDMLVNEQYKAFIPEHEQVISIIPYHFTINNKVISFDPVGMSGAKLGASFHILTADKNAVRNIERSVIKAGLHVKEHFVKPIVVAEGLIDDEDKEAGVAVVDIGGSTTGITVFHDGVLKHVTVVPIGGNNITNDIRLGLGLLRSQAEQLKVIYGMAVSTHTDLHATITVPGARGMQAKEILLKSLAVIIEEAMQEILDYVVCFLKQKNIAHELNGGIILTGGGSQLKNIKSLAEQMTGMSVRLANISENLEENELSKVLNNSCSACLGLLLHVGRILNKPVDIVPLAEEIVDKKLEAILAATNDNESAMHATVGFAIEDENLPRKNKRINRFMDILKEKFMGLFEEVEDEKAMRNKL
jgi:cell division protein FtsA